MLDLRCVARKFVMNWFLVIDLREIFIINVIRKEERLIDLRILVWLYC